MTAPTLPTEAEIRARLARHGLTEHGMDSQVAIVLGGLDTLDNLDAAWDRLHASMASRAVEAGSWADEVRP